MNQPDREDADLRAAFETVRKVDLTETPPFARVRAGRRRTERRWSWLLVPAAVAAAVVAIVVARSKPAEPPEWLQMTAGQLRTPTDFLLEVSGAENLSTVPSIGATGGWFPLDSKSKDNRL